MRTILQTLGLLLLLTLSSCSSSKTRAELIGFWESTDAKKASSVTFEKEGYLVFSGKAKELLSSKAMKIVQDFDMNLPIKTFTFKVTDKEHLEVQGDFSSLMEKLSAGAKDGSAVNNQGYDFHPVETLTFAVAGKELTLTSPNGKSIKFQRSE